jgi:predicted lipoprotein with Yx(FWY)xxD motif
MSKPSTSMRGSRFSGRRKAIGVIAVSGAAVLATAALSLASGAAASPVTLKVTQNASWGPTLALKNGDTVYGFSKDAKNKSNCTGTCAVDWPPVLLSSGQKTPDGAGVKDLGVIMRANGTHQVTYEGIPLYRFIGDKKAGQVNGNVTAFGGTWWSINPKSPHTRPTEKSGSGSSTGTSGSTGGSGGTTTTTTPPSGGIAY